MPTIVVVETDRPAILTIVKDKATGPLVTFGACGAAILDVVIGRAREFGHLPFALPRSTDAALQQDSAQPDAAIDRLYPRGAGLAPG